MGLGALEEGGGAGEGILDDGLWDRVVFEVDESGFLEAGKDGVGGGFLLLWGSARKV